MRDRVWLGGLVGALLLAIAPATSQADLISVASWARVEAEADADRVVDPGDPGWQDPDFTQQTDFANQGTTLATLATNATAFEEANGAGVTSQGSSVLSFTGADEGVAVFTTDWSVTGLVSPQRARVAVRHEAVYEFTVSGSNLLLDVDYAVVTSGLPNAFGMTNYGFSLFGVTSTSFEDVGIDNDLGRETSVLGRHSFGLVDGETYRLTFYANPNVEGDLGETTLMGTGTFNFSVSTNAAVPEPSSVAMIAIGAIGLGAHLRRRSRRLTA